VGDRLLRVYKNLWPSLRVFWLSFSNVHKEKTYIIYENQRSSYAEIFRRSLVAASVYRDVYGVKKGDRIGICSRNYTDYLTAWWGCQLIGAVGVLTNAYVPTLPFECL
jgi:acyl-CoA synthetase (AMP-forming)/AMP-acid ligase II